MDISTAYKDNNYKIHVAENILKVSCLNTQLSMIMYITLSMNMYTAFTKTVNYHL